MRNLERGISRSQSLRKSGQFGLFVKKITTKLMVGSQSLRKSGQFGLEQKLELDIHCMGIGSQSLRKSGQFGLVQNV